MSTDHYPPDGDPNYYEEVDTSETEYPVDAQDRRFWGMMGLSYVFNGLAIYGCWTEKLSPWLTWPMILSSLGLLIFAARFLRKR